VRPLLAPQAQWRCMWRPARTFREQSNFSTSIAALPSSLRMMARTFSSTSLNCVQPRDWRPRKGDRVEFDVRPSQRKPGKSEACDLRKIDSPVERPIGSARRVDGRRSFILRIDASFDASD